MTNTDYANALALLTNICTLDESMLLSLAQPSESIGSYMNSNKTKVM